MNIGEINGVQFAVSPEAYEEIKKQKIIIENKILKEQQQELERYKNIIDELEKWLVLQRDNLDKRVSEMKSDDKNMTRANHYTFIYNRVIDKLKEFKEENNI